jgi:hypothetical protein
LHVVYNSVNALVCDGSVKYKNWRCSKVNVVGVAPCAQQFPTQVLLRQHVARDHSKRGRAAAAAAQGRAVDAAAADDSMKKLELIRMRIK